MVKTPNIPALQKLMGSKPGVPTPPKRKKHIRSVSKLMGQ